MKRIVVTLLFVASLFAANIGVAFAAPNECPGSNDPVKDPITNKWTCDLGGGVGDGAKPKHTAPGGW